MYTLSGFYSTPNYPPRCVVCGLKLFETELRNSNDLGMPGSCSKHLAQVVKEVELDLPDWPADWRGDWEEDVNFSAGV